MTAGGPNGIVLLTSIATQLSDHSQVGLQHPGVRATPVRTRTCL